MKTRDVCSKRISKRAQVTQQSKQTQHTIANCGFENVKILGETLVDNAVVILIKATTADL